MERFTVAGSRYSQSGVTYLWMLFLVFLMGLGLGKTLEIQSVASQRDREAELLLAGAAYRDAIKAYSLSAPDGVARYPESLAVLLKDPRFPVPKRYLRRLYPDPITGGPFVIIPAPEGGIAGVHSSSRRQPLKRSGFAAEEQAFEHAQSYQGWQFVYK